MIVHRSDVVNSPSLASARASRAPRRWPPGFTIAAGAFYTCMAGVHLGVVVANPQVYASYGEAASMEWVSRLWAQIFMANPAFWGLVAAGLEVLIGVLLLVGGRASRLGWVAVAAFQVALILLGWGYLFWIVPALAIAVLGARHDWPLLARPATF